MRIFDGYIDISFIGIFSCFANNYKAEYSGGAICWISNTRIVYAVLQFY